MVCVVRVVGKGRAALDIGGTLELRTASIGKLLLLTQLAARIEAGADSLASVASVVDRRASTCSPAPGCGSR